jgi:hypothetical protein
MSYSINKHVSKKEIPEVIALLKLKKDLDNRPKLNFPRFEIEDIIDKHIEYYRVNWISK